MSPLILFGLLLLLTFGVLVVVLRPTRTEADVQRHLSSIGMLYKVDAEGSTILKREELSSIPWLNELLQGLPGAAELRLLITQAGLTWTVATVLLGSLVAAIIMAWVAFVFVNSLILAALAGIVLGSTPYIYLFAKRAMRFQRFEQILPEAIDLMSRALRAGHAVSSMIEMVAQESAEPVASEFRIVYEEQNLGLPLREAILNLARRVPIDDVRFLVTAILVQNETGGNLAEILDKTAFIMRERMRLRGQLRIYTAQGRVSGWILCALPFVMFFLIGLVNPKYEKKLLTDPMGLHIVYAGLVLMTLGIFIIRKIVDIKV